MDNKSIKVRLKDQLNYVHAIIWCELNNENYTLDINLLDKMFQDVDERLYAVDGIYSGKFDSMENIFYFCSYDMALQFKLMGF